MFKESNMIRSFFRLFILLVCLLPLYSCLFVHGIPLTGDDEEDETWPLNLTGKVPLSNYPSFSPDNSLVLTFSNSFDSSKVGQVSFLSPPTVFDRVNSVISYTTTTYPNDTLTIRPHSNFTTSTNYSFISLTGFYDFKGNPVETLSDSTYSFRTASSFNPDVLHYIPYTGTTRVTPYLAFKVSFNEPLDSVLNGTLSIDSPSPITFENGVNCTMSLSKSMVHGDTLTIRPNSPLAANRYMGLKIDGFQDHNGNPMNLFELASFNMQVSGLLAEYRFNNNFDDSSANKYNAAAIGSPIITSDRYGNVNGAVGFNGIDSYLDCTGLTEFGDPGGNFTIMLWMSPGSITPYNQSFLSKDTNFTMSNPGNSEVQLDLFEYNKVRVMIGDSAGSDVFSQLRSTTLVNVGSWYHVAVVAAEDNMKLFINGALEAEYINPRGYSSLAPLVLGKSDDYEQLEASSSRHFKGKLDEVKVYNHPLSDSEITNIYNSEKP